MANSLCLALPDDVLRTISDQYLSDREKRQLGTTSAGCFEMLQPQGSGLALCVSRHKQVVRLSSLFRWATLVLPMLWVGLGSWRMLLECHVADPARWGKPHIRIVRVLLATVTCLLLATLRFQIYSSSSQDVVRRRFRSSATHALPRYLRWLRGECLLDRPLLAAALVALHSGLAIWETESILAILGPILVVVWYEDSASFFPAVWLLVPTDYFFAFVHRSDLLFSVVLVLTSISFVGDVCVHKPNLRRWISQGLMVGLYLLILLALGGNIAGSTVDPRWRLERSPVGDAHVNEKPAMAAACNALMPAAPERERDNSTVALLVAPRSACWDTEYRANVGPGAYWMVLVAPQRDGCDLERLFRHHPSVAGLILAAERGNYHYTWDDDICWVHQQKTALRVPVPVMYVDDPKWADALESGSRSFRWLPPYSLLPQLQETRRRQGFCLVGNTASFLQVLLSLY